LALAAALKSIEPDTEIIWGGTAQGIEAELVADAGYKFKPIKVIGLRRNLSLYSLKSIILMGWAALRAWVWFKQIKPTVVVGMGGYVSLPFALAARRRYPLVILEQNSVPGLANRISGRWARVIAATYKESKAHFPHPEKVVVTGNPVRQEVLKSRAESLPARSAKTDTHKVTVIIFGGSRGARHINQVAVDMYPLISELSNLRIIHIAGNQEYETTLKLLVEQRDDSDKIDYRLYPYIKKIWTVYAGADLIVGRAGATTLAEITAAGLAAILIPYPYATNNHQYKNAAELERVGAARIVPDSELNSAVLWQTISDIIFHRKLLKTMGEKSLAAGRPQAAVRVAELVLAATGNSVN